MAAIYKIEESGVEIVSLASPHDLYYVLDGDRLLQPQSEIGYCEDCSGYTWIENLSLPDNDERLARLIEGWPEWHSQFAEYLKTRQTPPRCLHCSGKRIAQLEFNSGEGINPITGKHYTIRLTGTGCIPGLEPLFLTKDGCRLELPKDRAEQPAKRGRGHLFA